MKSAFLVCAVLTGGLFVAFVLSLDSCHSSYEINERGCLTEVRQDTSTTPPTIVRSTRNWDGDLAPFIDLERRMIPGDKLTLTRTISLVPGLNLEMRRLVVMREGRELLVARSGHYRFWAVGVGLSLAPMLVWGIIAVCFVTLPSRPRPPDQNAGSP